MLVATIVVLAIPPGWDAGQFICRFFLKFCQQLLGDHLHCIPLGGERQIYSTQHSDPSQAHSQISGSEKQCTDNTALCTHCEPMKLDNMSLCMHCSPMLLDDY